MPTLEAAVSGISIAEHLLAQTIAACTQFQVDAEAADATEALESIYFDALPPPDDRDSFTREELIDLRPFVIVATHPTESGFRLRRDSAEGFVDSGRAVVDFEYNVPEELTFDNQALMRQFKNKLGAILWPDPTVLTGYVGMIDLAHRAGYLAMDEISLQMIGRCNEKLLATYGDFLFARFIISWGAGR